MLCPSALAGSIIGRAGAVISQLNHTTGARIKVSQNKEFFPTTNDRVIAISGSLDAISAALVELVTKIIEVCKHWTFHSWCPLVCFVIWIALLFPFHLLHNFSINSFLHRIWNSSTNTRYYPLHIRMTNSILDYTLHSITIHSRRTTLHHQNHQHPQFGLNDTIYHQRDKLSLIDKYEYPLHNSEILLFAKSPERKEGGSTDISTPFNRPFQIRLLIPMAASGIMIGRQGTFICRCVLPASWNLLSKPIIILTSCTKNS